MERVKVPPVDELMQGFASLRERFTECREASRAPAEDDWDELGSMLESLRDYAELARTARRSDALLRAVIESLPFDFWAIGKDGRYALQNSACRDHWGDVIGTRPQDAAPSSEIRDLWTENNRRAFAGETVRGEVTYTFESEARWYFNILSPVYDDDQIVGIMGVNLDITDEKRLADEMQRSQKLESLGLLAGGIAHDFNNLLTGISGLVSHAILRLDDDLSIRQLLEKAERGCTRAQELAQRLLTFARGSTPIRRPTDLAPLLDESMSLSTSGTSSRYELDIADGLWWGDVDAGQVAQVFRNLAINSVQAMPDGGTIRVSARNVDVDDASAQNLEPRRHIHIVVSDQGSGIAADDVKRIFDPYFTTRDGGHGLGLAIVHSVIEKHQGVVRVGTQHSGAALEIFLPAASAHDPSRAVASVDDTRFTGSVLVVDDDELVRDAVETMLAAVGFEVTTASGCDDAVAQYAERLDSDRYRVVIIDLTMRGSVGGRECFEKLRALDGSVRAIVTSGYSTDPVLAHYRAHGFRAALPKPYSQEQLTAAVEEALE